MASSLPKVGSSGPAIRLPDQHGIMHTLAQYRGQWVLVYFYPKDDTPGCTKEACAIRDQWSAFAKEKIVVLGVSVDAPARHEKFVSKYKLPFTLLADTEKKTVKDYGVWGEKKFMGRTYQGIRRQSFIIDPKGRIAKVYETVKAADHATEVLKDIRALKKM